MVIVIADLHSIVDLAVLLAGDRRVDIAVLNVFQRCDVTVDTDDLDVTGLAGFLQCGDSADDSGNVGIGQQRCADLRRCDSCVGGIVNLGCNVHIGEVLYFLAQPLHDGGNGGRACGKVVGDDHAAGLAGRLGGLAHHDAAEFDIVSAEEAQPLRVFQRLDGLEADRDALFLGLFDKRLVSIGEMTGRDDAGTVGVVDGSLDDGDHCVAVELVVADKFRSHAELFAGVFQTVAMGLPVFQAGQRADVVVGFFADRFGRFGSLLRCCFGGCFSFFGCAGAQRCDQHQSGEDKCNPFFHVGFSFFFFVTGMCVQIPGNPCGNGSSPYRRRTCERTASQYPQPVQPIRQRPLFSNQSAGKAVLSIYCGKNCEAKPGSSSSRRLPSNRPDV